MTKRIKNQIRKTTEPKEEIYYKEYQRKANTLRNYDRSLREDRDHISPRFLYPNNYLPPKRHVIYKYDFGRSHTETDEFYDSKPLHRSDFGLCPRHLNASHRKCEERYYQQDRGEHRRSKKKSPKEDVKLSKSTEEDLCNIKLTENNRYERNIKLSTSDRYRNTCFHELRQQRLEEDERLAYDNNFDDYKRTVKYYNPRELYLQGGGRNIPCHNYDYEQNCDKEFYPYNPKKEYNLEKAKSSGSLRNQEYKSYYESKPNRKYFKFEERVEEKYPEEKKEYQKLAEIPISEPQDHYVHPRYMERKRNEEVRENMSKPKEEVKESPPKEEKKVMQEEVKISTHSTPKKDNQLKISELDLLANQFRIYAELQNNEEEALSDLFVQKNYSIFKAFEKLNSHHGLINSESLLIALNENLGINIDDITITEDLIARLAYSSESSLMMSDMKFFEPDINHPAYEIYKSNISHSQNSKDKSWIAQYKQVWECLIETDFNRRKIQREMIENHNEIIDLMYAECNFKKDHYFTIEDLENFVNRHLKDKLSKQMIECLMKALDRDEDNLVSYIEFKDAIYGPE